jgi:acetyltransferase-like isoleucine patch superfamily enzyme
MPINQCKFEQTNGDFVDTEWITSSKKLYYDWLQINFRIYHPKLVNLYGSQFGYGTKIAAFVEVGGSIIGRNCSIQCHVSIPPGTTVGNKVFFGPSCHIANDRYPKANNKEWKAQGTIIEDDVSIGMGALIGPGLRLGKGCVIGMGANVLHDVEPWTTVVGNPARVIRDKEGNRVVEGNSTMRCTECNEVLPGGPLILPCPKCCPDWYEPLED